VDKAFAIKQLRGVWARRKIFVAVLLFTLFSLCLLRGFPVKLDGTDMVVRWDFPRLGLIIERIGGDSSYDSVSVEGVEVVYITGEITTETFNMLHFHCFRNGEDWFNRQSSLVQRSFGRG